MVRLFPPWFYILNSSLGPCAFHAFPINYEGSAPPCPIRWSSCWLLGTRSQQYRSCNAMWKNGKDSVEVTLQVSRISNPAKEMQHRNLKKYRSKVKWCVSPEEPVVKGRQQRFWQNKIFTKRLLGFTLKRCKCDFQQFIVLNASRVSSEYYLTTIV